MIKKLYLEQEQMYTVDDLKKQIEDEFIKYLKTEIGETTFTVDYPFDTSPMYMQMSDQDYYTEEFDLFNDNTSKDFWNLLCEFINCEDLTSDEENDVKEEITENLDEYNNIVQCFEENVQLLLENEYDSLIIKLIKNEFGEEYLESSNYLPYLEGYLTLDVEDVYIKNNNEIVITVNTKIDFDKLKSNIEKVLKDILGSNYGLTNDELNNTKGFTEEEIKNISKYIIYEDSDSQIIEEIIYELDDLSLNADSVVEVILENRREFDYIYPDFTSSKAKEYIQTSEHFDEQIDDVEKQIEVVQSNK